MAKTKIKRKRKPKFVYTLKWGEVQYQPCGNRYWESDCGKFRIVASEIFYGISMPLVYKLWHRIYFRGAAEAGWFLFNEIAGRQSKIDGTPIAASYKNALKSCEIRKQEYENGIDAENGP